MEIRSVPAHPLHWWLHLNLSNYIFKEGATILGTSATGVLTIATLTTGSHNITCTATSAQGFPVTLNMLSVSITQGLTVSINVQGNTTICNGDTVKLSASISGTSYLWSNGATSSSINVLSAGTYTLTVTNAQGCTGQTTCWCRSRDRKLHGKYYSLNIIAIMPWRVQFN